MEQQITARPRNISEEGLKIVAQKLLPKVIEWMYQGHACTDKDKTEVTNDLVRILEDSEIDSYDGYAMAKSAEDHCYWSDPDEALVDIFSSAWSLVENQKSEAVKEWIAQNNIQPQFNINDQVSFKYKGKTENGVIVSVYPERGSYCINCEHLGHVKPGSRIAGTHGYIINFEDAFKA